ncbi:glycosyltransferase [Mycobacterium heidelbergense]|uniref:Glycosyltransferase n=1 Tax=Mycobacterium heidelbergense TaxID=53376 RepID=A0A1X0DTE9_MYCHE|nr:glycosyltransferase [Mycobacterium heidelbergense]MCV7051522.1 glycosyltransferase [Mycobacterium heidelbergense]ORA75607.1 glycosyltransferase [Mycobacterium heidelbergense]BBZ48480.1 putative glycosyltransferase [Mycobacterium heidelbergense]
MKFVLAGYGSRGDVEPCAAVGRELRRRGHDVRMAVPPDKLGFVESAGLAAVAYGPDTRERIDAAQEFVRNVRNPIGALPEAVEHLTRTWMDKSATLTSLAQGADLLVAGINEQKLAANVAEYHGIPLAALHFFPARILSTGLLYSATTAGVANAQRRALGLPEAAESSSQPGALEIQAYDEICLPGPAGHWVESNGRRPFVGALTLESPTGVDDEVLSWIAAGEPPICFGLGSTPISSPADTVAMIGAACAQLGVRALVCSGPNDFTTIPHLDHVKVVEAVNHAAVLPACRAVVHHGGAGATAAGLRAGIPTLVLWLWLDQPMWAAAVERLGVGFGRQLVATTPESLAADLGSVLAPRCVASAREVAARMTKSAESLAKAADLLEDAAARG